MKYLFAVHDWGLGHATRDLLLIRALLDADHEVTVLTTGRALVLLRQELGERCRYIDYPDIPKPLGRSAFGFYVRMTLSMPAVLRRFRLERAYTRRLCREQNFDCVISDSRMGVVSTQVPSYYIFHSLRQIMPRPLRALSRAVERNQQRLLSSARLVLVPDEEADGGIAGALCHDTDCDWSGRIAYLGILSGVAAQDVETDVDVFVSISGAEPQRGYFEEKILAQVAGLAPRRVVVTLGRPDLPYRCWEHGGATVHTYLDRLQQQALLNRARLVVTRSGYTTLMELAELGKRALLVPTVGQSEQEYLADYHHERGHAHAVRQPQLQLDRDVPLAERTAGLPRVHPTRESIRRFLDIVTATTGGA
ncbi:glycosyltransferase [Acidihalobacter ferrooxydans]|uniref:glycosyltransferase n=1 Tax=Acidihalobacter ferrooxydans TaxID=1765967 RepID=UPI0018DBEC60|nr:glycosyltransferase [Acidihalobacter ferrooxydans]